MPRNSSLESAIWINKRYKIAPITTAKVIQKIRLADKNRLANNDRSQSNHNRTNTHRNISKSLGLHKQSTR